MKADPTCPRCGGDLHRPGIWSSAWTCDVHGGVHPLQPVVAPTVEGLRFVVESSKVPVWLPWPLPRGWLVTGIAHCGDERTGARAVVIACSGPAPLGGSGELVLVAEEPGIGLGARYAGLDGPDAGSLPDTAAHAKIHASGHPTAMWCIPVRDDRAVYVGEALGCWLWSVTWPEGAGYLLHDDLVLTDLRSVGHELDVPMGALSPRLRLGPG